MRMVALLGRAEIPVAQGRRGGRDRVIGQSFVHGGGGRQVARAISARVQAHGLHVAMVGGVGGSGDRVLAAGRAVHGRLVGRVVQGQRGGYTCPRGGHERRGELAGAVRRAAEGGHDVVHAEALRRALALVVVLFPGAVQAERAGGRDAVRAAARHAAAAVGALNLGNGAERGRNGLRRRGRAVLGFNVLNAHGHWLFLVAALLRLLRLLLLLAGWWIFNISVVLILHSVFLFKTPSSPQKAAVLKHVIRVRVEGPVAAFARFFVIARHFDKALVQGQVVSDTVLPTLLVVPVKGKALHNKLINTVKGHLLVRGVLDGHSDERNVTVRWFDHILGLRLRRVRSISPRHAGGVLVVGRVRVHAHGGRHPGVPPSGGGPVITLVAADVRHNSQRVGTGDGIARLHDFSPNGAGEEQTSRSLKQSTNPLEMRLL